MLGSLLSHLPKENTEYYLEGQSKEDYKEKMGQKMLETTFRKRRPCWFGYVQHTVDYRTAKQTLH